MVQSFTGRKRIRKTFGRIPEVAPMPNLIEVQMSSYKSFLQMEVPPEQRLPHGLQEVFRSVFPIKDFSERSMLEFVKYELEPPKYDVDECQQRGMTFAAPLKVTLRLVVWDVDEETEARVDPRHQGAGRLHGRHAAHDGQRHFHHQRHRARDRLADAPLAGRVLRPRQGQDAFLGQVSVRGARDPLSRLVARLRVRRQGSRLCAHRPPPQAAGHDAADGARQRREREDACAARGREQAARAGRGAGHERGGDPVVFLRPGRLHARQEGLEDRVQRRAHARLEADQRPDRRQVGQGAGRGRHQDHAAPGQEDQGRRRHRGARDPRGHEDPLRRRRHHQREDGRDLCRGRRRADRAEPEDAGRGRGQHHPDPAYRPYLGRPLHAQHAEGRQEQLTRRRADRDLPRDASRRAADPGDGRDAVRRLVLRRRALRPVRGRPREDELAAEHRLPGYGAHAAQGRHPRRSSRCWSS